MDRAELAKRVFGASHLTGTFRLRSGQTSNEYFDKYRFEADPTLLRDIAAAMAPMIPAGTEALAGLEMGGIPLATALSLETGIECCFVRKAAKEYGTCKLAEGNEIEGKVLCVVEDVITTGGQVILSSDGLRKAGAQVEHVLCVIDREAGGSAKLAAEGLALRSLFTMSELKAASA